MLRVHGGLLASLSPCFEALVAVAVDGCLTVELKDENGTLRCGVGLSFAVFVNQRIARRGC